MMVQRLFSTTRWLFCLSVLHISVRLVRTLSVPTKEPYGIEAQAKFFQYRHLPTSEDFDQGHRQGSERHFVERHERSRPSKGLYAAKVRWGDKNGGYGEHYWDLNHAGYTDNHGDDYNGDDGSYHEEPSDTYNGPDDSGSYDSESYSDDVPQYEETGRIKRAHSKTSEHSDDDDDVYEEQQRPKQRIRTKNRNRRERYEETDEDDQVEDIEPTTKSPKIKSERTIEEEGTTEVQKSKEKRKEHRYERPHQEKEKNHFVLVVKEKEREEEQPDRTLPIKQKQSEPKRFVKYEDGAGVRQHTNPEALASASAPRLFLETQTGHIVDRMTGQAYVLQPVANKYNK